MACGTIKETLQCKRSRLKKNKPMSFVFFLLEKEGDVVSDKMLAEAPSR